MLLEDLLRELILQFRSMDDYYVVLSEGVRGVIMSPLDKNYKLQYNFANDACLGLFFIQFYITTHQN